MFKPKIRRKNKSVEHSIQDSIIKYLRLNKFVVVRINGGAFTDDRNNYIKTYTIVDLKLSSGLSDLLVMKEGIFAFLEIKSDAKKQLSVNQKIVSDYFNSKGIDYFKVSSIDEVQTIVKQLENNNLTKLI